MNGPNELLFNKINLEVVIIYKKFTKPVTKNEPTIPKYKQKEMDTLRGLNIDELKTMCEAKQLFRGTNSKILQY